MTVIYPCFMATRSFVFNPAANLDAALATGESDAGGAGAEMVFYEHSGGGLVFSVGSLTFGGSLVVDSTIQQQMQKVLSRAGVV